MECLFLFSQKKKKKKKGKKKSKMVSADIFSQHFEG